MKKKNFKKVLAFTLAEVLITLSILGVVAAITVPTIIQKNQKREVGTRLAKIHSTLENAFDQMVAESGKPIAQLGDLNTVAENTIRSPKYLNVTYISESGEYSYSTSPFYKYEYKYSHTDKKAGQWYGGVFLKDGTVLTTGYIGVSKRVFIMIDINGKKGPNTLNKDTFYTYLSIDPKSGSLKFDEETLSKSNLRNRCNYSFRYSETDYSYDSCYAYILQNHFKIPSDYPWL